MKQNENIYDKNIVEFVTVAVQFCNMLESVAETQRTDFLDKITKVLPLMYVKADLLPDYDTDDIPETEQFVDEENYNIIRGNLAFLLGHYDDFLDVFLEDMKYSDRPILSTISENLADIYQDVKNFVMNFKVAAQDDIILEAVAACKDNFRLYWGQKLVNVMRPLHELKYSTMQQEED